MPSPNHSEPSFMLGKGLMQVFSPGGKRGLSILIYHRVLAQKDALFPAEVDRAEFDAQIGMLKSMFNVIPLTDAIARSRNGTLPPRAACITFDDGYADNAEVALPVLQQHGVHATFFVASGFLNGGRMWNDTVIELVRRTPGPTLDARVIDAGTVPVGSMAERQAAIGTLIGKLKYLPMAERLAQVQRLADANPVALPTDLMMTTEQILRLHRAGMEIGGHTVNHPILAAIPAAEARAEIAEGKAALEAMIGEPLRLFAYPNGKPGADYRAEHVAMVKELQFEGAVSTSWGASKDNADLFELPRFTPWDKSRVRFAVRMAKNLASSAARA